ncbi:hypothetical protein V6C03_09030 [Methyloligella sp. 2.7D]|uniref:cell division protein FtsL n=1 Tax=unclassified Methyloligella TaxID=2625955 RepID=UPI00157CB58B|nr:hypothetical protein [Methyloligella sp. GL2]QKP77997.1 hypothetical protein HT051_11420 [Methyloligella sp. GL2]
MLRFVNICLLLGLVGLSYVIYDVKYEARGLDHDITVLHKKIDEEKDSIAVLRAEWSLLNRPERIERLAGKFLNLEPSNPRQILTLDSVSQAEFDAKLATAGPPEQDVPDYVKLLQDTD